MSGPPPGPDECSWDPDYQDFIFQNKLRAAASRGDFDTCDQLADQYNNLHGEPCLITDSPAKDQDPLEELSLRGSRLKLTTMTKPLIISLSSAKLRLNGAIGKSCK